MRCSLRESEDVRDSAAAGVAYGRTGGRLLGSRWSALISHGGRRSLVDSRSSLSDILMVSVGTVAGSSMGSAAEIECGAGGAAT